jgi:hypothetical protein
MITKRVRIVYAFLFLFAFTFALSFTLAQAYEEHPGCCPVSYCPGTQIVQQWGHWYTPPEQRGESDTLITSGLHSNRWSRL